MAVLTKDHSDADLVTYVNSCYLEADNARDNRDRATEQNYDAYHMRHDFSHKSAGQSKETLAKVRMSVESTKSFFQQALSDITEWMAIELKDPTTDPGVMLIKPHEVKKLLSYQLEQAGYFRHVGLSVQRALLGGVMISKIHGKLISKPKFRTKQEGKGKSFKKSVEKVEDKTWRLQFSRVRNENCFPDPTGNGLYFIEEMYMDMHEVMALSKGDDAIYDMSEVEKLSTTYQMEGQDAQEKARETGQTIAGYTNDHRPQVKIREYWGNIVSNDGTLLYENVVTTIANDRFVIRKPTPNPLWHQMNPYNFTPLLDVDGAMWPIALMDAGSQHQHTMTELLNLILDAAFKHVHSPSQIRVQDLMNPEQVSNGIPPGIALKVKSSLPPGAKVMEQLDVTDVPNDALNVLNIVQQEFNSSALTTDLRSGVLPSRSVKATEVVEQSQTITSVFQGITKNIEQSHIVREVEMAWMEVAQNLDMISKDELISLFGIDRGTALSQLDPQDVFVQTVNGYKFKVSGISQTLAKAQDFRKLTTLLQTISASELLIESFLGTYDMSKLLGEIMSSLDIDKHKIEIEQQAGVLRGQGGEEQPAGIAPTQDQASTPSAATPGSPFAEIFGGNLPAAGGPQ